MNQYGYALLGLTAIVAMLVGVLMIAVLKLVSSTRRTRRRCWRRRDRRFFRARSRMR